MIGVKIPKPIIGKIIPQSIAFQAGLEKTQEIKTIDNNRVRNWQEAAMAIISRLGDRGYMLINKHNLNLQQWTINPLNPNPILALGIEPYHPFVPPIINKVSKKSAAEKIGMQAKDQILAVNGKSIKSWDSLIKYIQQHPNEQLKFTIKRSNRQLTLTGYTSSKLGRNWKRIGYLGISSIPVKWPKEMLWEQHYSVPQAILPALFQTWALLKFNAVVLSKMVTGKMSLRVLGGPITIFSATEQAFKQGLVAYLGFLALLSIMLAFINILPIPGLDGGNLVFLLIETIIRRPIPQKIQMIAIRLGMAIIATLIFIAIGNDLMRLFLTN